MNANMLFAEFPWQVFMTPFGIPLAGIVGVFAWLSVNSISEAVSKFMCNRNDIELKMELLTRGFSAEEIARTVESGRASPALGPAQALSRTAGS